MSISTSVLVEKIEEAIRTNYITIEHNPLEPNKACQILYLYLRGVKKNWLRRHYGFLLPTINRLLKLNQAFINEMRKLTSDSLVSKDQLPSLSSIPSFSLNYEELNFKRLAHLYPNIIHELAESSVKPTSTADRTPLVWTCKKGHTYEASIYSRIRSNGCKKCNSGDYSSNRAAKNVEKSGSLFEVSPSLKEEWDTERNTLDPQRLTTGSNLSVWWKCKKCNHRWLSPIKQRKTSGCPECTKKELPLRRRRLAVKKRGKSLFDEYPNLLKEWDTERNTISPKDITVNSKYKAYWKCEFEHRWQAVVGNRTRLESGCPECKANTSRIEVYVLCEMRSIFRYVEWRKKIRGFECDIYVPSLRFGIEVDGGYWHTDKLAQDERKTKILTQHDITLFRVRENTLPNINGLVVHFGKSDKKQTVVNRLTKLMCKTLESESLKIYSHEMRQRGRKEYKSILAQLPKPTEGDDLQTMFPEIASEFDLEKNNPLTPDMFSYSANKKVHWSCSVCQHSWQTSINNRTAKQSGCPKCYDNTRNDLVRSSKLSKKGESFADEFPEFIDQWSNNNDFQPNELSSGSNVIVNFECNHGHSYSRRLAYVTESLRNSSLKVTCPECYKDMRSKNLRRLNVQKKGELFVTNPELKKQWLSEKNKFPPSEYHKKMNDVVWWKCLQHGDIFEQRISSRARGVRGCPTCKKEMYQARRVSDD